MAKWLQLSLDTGRVEIPNLPGDDASADEKNDRTIALLGEINAECDRLEEQVEAEPREALKQAWVLHTVLEAHPKNWVKDFGSRREVPATVARIEGVRARAAGALGEEAAAVWADLPFIHRTLPLLWAKQRASDEIKRLILTPLGKLKVAKIDYQRESADDLARVCQELENEARKTVDLDDEVKPWGAENRDALLLGRPPVVIPKELVGGSGGALAMLALGLALIGAAGAAHAQVLGATVAGLPASQLALGLGAAGLLPAIIGVVMLARLGARKAAAPAAFADLSDRFRERLYLICALRTLYLYVSRYNVTVDALKRHFKEHGGKQRWKKVKFEQRDLTEVFVEDRWDERGTIELWLSEKVNERFRLESSTLAAPEDLDPEAWDIILRAYLLESVDRAEPSDGTLLAVVSELLFTRRGEDAASERERVFAQVRAAWQRAEAAEGKAI